MRGKKAFMFTKKDYDALLATENIQAALRRLETTRYKPFISKLAQGEPDIGEIEESLTGAYQAEVRFILSKLKNEDAINLLWWINRSHELKCISLILKSIILGVTWEKAAQFTVPYGKINSSTCKALVDGKNVKNTLQLINFVEERTLVQEVEKILKETAEPTRQALAVETAIDKFTIEKIWEKSASLSGKDLSCIRLIGITLDIQTIMTILRMKKLGFKPEEIEKNIPPIQFKLKDEVRKAVASPTEKDAVKIFTSGYYVNVISPVVGTYEIRGDLSIFEVAFKRYHAKECEKMFYSIFHLGEALGYLHLSWYEVRDLTAILVGKYFGFPSDKIESSLTLHQPPYP